MTLEDLIAKDQAARTYHNKTGGGEMPVKYYEPSVDLSGHTPAHEARQMSAAPGWWSLSQTGAKRVWQHLRGVGWTPPDPPPSFLGGYRYETSGWHRPNGISLGDAVSGWVEFKFAWDNSLAGRTPNAIGFGDLNDRLFVEIANDTRLLSAEVGVGGVNRITHPQIIEWGVVHTCRVEWSGADFSLYLDGQLVDTATSGTGPGDNVFGIGSRGNDPNNASLGFVGLVYDVSVGKNGGEIWNSQTGDYGSSGPGQAIAMPGPVERTYFTYTGSQHHRPNVLTPTSGSVYCRFRTPATFPTTMGLFGHRDHPNRLALSIMGTGVMRAEAGSSSFDSQAAMAPSTDHVAEMFWDPTNIRIVFDDVEAYNGPYNDTVEPFQFYLGACSNADAPIRQYRSSIYHIILRDGGNNVLIDTEPQGGWGQSFGNPQPHYEFDV